MAVISGDKLTNDAYSRQGSPRVSIRRLAQAKKGRGLQQIQLGQSI
ncbi:hypothetical protein [Klebsiella pneumoniae IS43]|uniref:Uncharacterized protein n=1 Tax=Klebsiella pneumoniae IS43 TaxID=1432552 RepID=W1DHS6_KLEPN|nr:hypothetical protein [Klebsiella pneumoniae IS43]